MIAIETKHLYKRFGSQEVLRDVSMQLEAGKIHGLIGDNGSGKSVLLKLLCGLIPSDQGEISILGKQIRPGSAKQPMMGIVIEHPGFLDTMSGLANLQYLAGIRGIATKQQINDALVRTGLIHDAKKKVKKYSLGMRQKLAIAQAIMENPLIYIMDEPFNGLDKATVAAMHQVFISLKNEGKTFLLVSHHASDIEALCDDVFEIADGMIRPCIR